MTTQTKQHLKCYHCGDDCPDDTILLEEKNFCCDGCRLVYEILAENNLGSFYSLNNTPGNSQKAQFVQDKYAFLDDERTVSKLIDFKDEHISKVTFYIPQIHCSSCIWLLENLYKLDASIIRSQVNFLKKEAYITYSNPKISLRKVVELLHRIGYEPEINLSDISDTSKTKKQVDRPMLYRIGVAGFCFGNIMMFSFPEYFSLGKYIEYGYGNVFGYINLGLSLPIFFYSSTPFFKNALSGMRQKAINIDVPIALGILVMFVRSAYEIISGTGAGFMDSLGGLVFFMLNGRLFQSKTYDRLSFDRDYRSYFPVAVSKIMRGISATIPLSELKTGDRILIRNNELIPADSILIKGEANIDYSFVTGESALVMKKSGSTIYAGGKQSGTAIELEVIKNVSQSYLTQLWNNETFKNKANESFQTLINKISKWFTISIIGISVGAALFWINTDFLRAMNAFTGVLMIACPCALALSSPFTLGNVMRILGRNKFYLKNVTVIEKLAKTNIAVFDKTGTITQPNNSRLEFIGEKLSSDEMQAVRSLIHHSSHPLSKRIYNELPTSAILPIQSFNERTGKGIEGIIGGNKIIVGSSSLTGKKDEVSAVNKGSKIFISINGEVKGYYSVRNEYREGFEGIIKALKRQNFKIAILSGDNDDEKEFLLKTIGKDAVLHFNQSPMDKLNFIKNLQDNHQKVLMIGDGLNDAGALMQSDVGICISDNINNFSPACDAIMEATEFRHLPQFIKVANSAKQIIYSSLIISILYNLIGLTFAVQGILSPVVAAILMPISSVTIIAFTTLSSNLIAKIRLRV